MDTPPQPAEPAPRRRGPPLVLLGGVAALLAGGAIAWVLVRGDRPEAPPPASEGGLVIDSSGGEEAGRIDPGKPLRCFVQGQFVGELSLSACAERNGVATDALDVGLDETGALAAAEQAGQVLTPLPPTPQDEIAPDAAPIEPVEDTEDAASAAASATACWRHGGGRWRKVAGDTDLDACVQALFAGRCERPGAATYGRFGPQTLRLVAGRVEISDDNRTFHTLAPQNADCSIPVVR
ncbi:MAG: hypothetical protein JNK30_07980 [Phenylobacterium sp.]|uniref:hypothetical protein n=1 Tax=Phenylobacterium sp. TaxID=1871053 RepID=UPI001A61B367|nr:hypothetical protein [Phenylobacterium sp.]MBL8771308.1 hypothetical protein [Phenylobacterium sp.]